jgi:hypothetical protein
MNMKMIKSIMIIGAMALTTSAFAERGDCEKKGHHSEMRTLMDSVGGIGEDAALAKVQSSDFFAKLPDEKKTKILKKVSKISTMSPSEIDKHKNRMEKKGKKTRPNHDEIKSLMDSVGGIGEEAALAKVKSSELFSKMPDNRKAKFLKKVSKISTMSKNELSKHKNRMMKKKEKCS